MSERIWPATLPKSPLVKGFWREPRPNFVQSKFEAGPPSTRLRTTVNLVDMDCPYSMTPVQFAAFKNFFEVSLAFGALDFDLPDPEDENITLNVQFREKAYRQTKVTAQEYIVSLPLMILP